MEIPTYIRQNLYSQKFAVDDLITDTTLINVIKAIGGDSLSRMTIASPCRDSLSLTRYGDTLRVADYLWMVLHINNDTSVSVGALALNAVCTNSIVYAGPDFKYQLHNEPNDLYYLGVMGSEQRSFKSDIMNIERAWDFQIGKRDIRIGVIDDGIYYPHCDLGTDLGFKVISGYNYSNNNSHFESQSSHGTRVAGIIGALTNRSCGSNNPSVAGIAGGWGPGTNDEDYRSKLFGFRCADKDNNNYILSKHAVSAIREGVYNYVSEDEEEPLKLDVINCSWEDYYDPALFAALTYAHAHGASVVTSRGNGKGSNYYGDGTNISYQYPACYPNDIITSVGAGRINKTKTYYSHYGLGMDFLAPGGYTKDKDGNNTPDEAIVYTTTYNSAPNWGWFDGTSAAAPHVSGLIALLRSEDWIGLAPEDYEGMLKASCEDQVYDQTDYITNYDEISGWGHVQADNIFNMIHEDDYICKHYSLENEEAIYHGDWIDIGTIYMGNEFSYYPLNQNYPKLYKAKYREIYGTIAIPSSDFVFDDNVPLYAWGWSRQLHRFVNGTGYRKPTYGRDQYSKIVPLPLLTDGFSEVTTGTGGNNIVPGIIHTNNRYVGVRAYQYELKDPQSNMLIGYFPDDGTVSHDLGLHITVFGKQIPLAVENQSQIIKNDIIVYPNPCSDKITIKLAPNMATEALIEIFDIIGNIVLTINSSGLNTKTINIETLESGIYYIKLQSEGSVKIIPFNVIK